ncbi:Major allergen Pru ar 1 [Sesamum alatum]|uniref:Major allergen Pru ar 1 n=1 Tax=Sesamum alatum TaxID=300844 RepID=A0AAE1Y850_9LAMI|nr:Major allergen Pru ar 1 [Sesamum alatum]
MILRFLPQSQPPRCLRLSFLTQTPLFLRSCLKLLKTSRSWKEMVVWELSRSSILARAANIRVQSTVLMPIDTENLTHSYTIVEGDALAGVLESITYHVKIVPTEDGGCICKNRSIYHTKGGVEINEEKIKEGKEKAMQMFKAIEAYLQANA